MLHLPYAYTPLYAHKKLVVWEAQDRPVLLTSYIAVSQDCTPPTRQQQQQQQQQLLLLLLQLLLLLLLLQLLLPLLL